MTQIGGSQIYSKYFCKRILRNVYQCSALSFFLGNWANFASLWQQQIVIAIEFFLPIFHICFFLGNIWKHLSSALFNKDEFSSIITPQDTPQQHALISRTCFSFPSMHHNNAETFSYHLTPPVPRDPPTPSYVHTFGEASLEAKEMDPLLFTPPTRMLTDVHIPIDGEYKSTTRGRNWW